MTRIPRRALRIQPPVRGRAAAVSQHQATQPTVRQPLPRRAGNTTIIKVVEKPSCEDLHPDWIALYQGALGLFLVLRRPWQWGIFLALLLALAVVLGKVL